MTEMFEKGFVEQIEKVAFERGRASERERCVKELRIYRKEMDMYPKDHHYNQSEKVGVELAIARVGLLELKGEDSPKPRKGFGIDIIKGLSSEGLSAKERSSKELK